MAGGHGKTLAGGKVNDRLIFRCGGTEPGVEVVSRKVAMIGRTGGIVELIHQRGKFVPVMQRQV